MAKGLFVLAAVALCIVAASGHHYEKTTTDKDFLLKQKKIYNLLYHFPQPDVVNPELYKLGKAWKIDDHIDSYTNKEAVIEYLKEHEIGCLPRGQIFSIYYPKLLKEAIGLFRVFYYAKDFDTFYNTALAARIHVNEFVFVAALYQAVILRPDTEYITLPPPYEFYPHGFFNSEVIEKAKNAHLYREIKSTPDSDGYNSIIINANYSGWYMSHDYDSEMKLNYFTEDIGLNTYYFWFRMESPFWLNSKDYPIEHKNVRGEVYLYGHKLMLARYNLERLANNLEGIEDFDWNSEFYPGYYPTMSYPNGLPVPQRPNWSKIPHYKYRYSQAIQDMESRVSAAIDLGYVRCHEGTPVKIYTPEGLNILGNMIEGNEDSCNKEFYGSIDYFGRKILGYNLEPKYDYQIIPSALESFTGCLRDPAFYRLYKRINYYYLRYKKQLKPYKRDEIVFPELKIESVVVDKLLTYFDDFDTTISNGLLVANQKEADSFLVKVRQQRLNHKPFNVHFGINAEKATKAAIQIFLGPKHDAQGNNYEFSRNYKYFYEIDYWVVDLVAGANKLERNCHDFFFTYDDPQPSEVFYKTLEKSLESGEAFKYEERIYGFPQRLILPKGKRAGGHYQLFVYVSPIVGDVKPYKSRVWGQYAFGSNPMGFPLDRPVEPSNFIGPNIYFKDISIYHKFEHDINATV